MRRNLHPRSSAARDTTRFGVILVFLLTALSGAGRLADERDAGESRADSGEQRELTLPTRNDADSLLQPQQATESGELPGSLRSHPADAPTGR